MKSGKDPDLETEMAAQVAVQAGGQESTSMMPTAKVDVDRQKENEIPPSDIYSDFVAANPWLAWWIGLGIMLGFAFLGLAVSYGAKGGFQIGGSSVGFEARNSTLAGKIIPMQNIRNMECINDLSLVANGKAPSFTRIPLLMREPRMVDTLNMANAILTTQMPMLRVVVDYILASDY